MLTRRGWFVLLRKAVWILLLIVCVLWIIVFVYFAGGYAGWWGSFND